LPKEKKPLDYIEDQKMKNQVYERLFKKIDKLVAAESSGEDNSDNDDSDHEIDMRKDWIEQKTYEKLIE